MTDILDAAQRRLETATIRFENLERLYTERRITTEALRLAWAEQEAAKRDVDRICRERFEGAGR